MLLRAALVILVMLNLGAAAWWALGPQASAATPRALTAPQLQLVSERAAKSTSASAPAVAATVCLRFGPFAGPAARTGARSALTAAGVAAEPFNDTSGAALGWDVFLPAQATRADAVALAAKLKEDGVSDLIVLNEGRNANRIALGRFSSEAGAQRRAAEVRAKGMEPEIEARGNGAPRAWLDARVPAGVDPATLAGIAPSQPIDCAHLH